MKTMTTSKKVGIGAALLLLLGGGWGWFTWSKTKQHNAEISRKQNIEQAQRLLAFFGRNQGRDVTDKNPTQRDLVSAFQTIWMQGLRWLPEYQDLPLIPNNGGRWDPATEAALKRLTGYTPGAGYAFGAPGAPVISGRFGQPRG